MTVSNRSAAFVGCLLLQAAVAQAHTRSESYSHWYELESGISATVTIPLREVMLLYQSNDAAKPPADTFRDELIAKTVVRRGSESCDASTASILQAPSGFVRIEMRFDCGSGPPDSISYRALFDAAPAHVHYASFHRGEEKFETLLTDTADTWHIEELDAGASWTLASFLGVGIGHIAGGIDHIAFLIGMLLIAGSIGRSIIAVTGFTLGHSVSLGAAVLGYVHADGTLVEAFIGFTVALVAVEFFLLRGNEASRETLLATSSLLVAWAVGLIAFTLEAISGRALFVYAGFGLFAYCYLLSAIRLERRDRSGAGTLLFVATTCFGLVHGFGFAGFLMETGLLGTSLFVPLLGFNLGVEVGQLALVVVVLGVAALLRGRVPAIAPAAVAAGLCGIGIYWFAGRTFLLGN